MKKKLLLFSLATFIGITAGADTIPVNRAYYVGPYALHMPYMADSTDMSRKKFDVDELLKSNPPTADNISGLPNTSTIQKGAAISAPTSGLSIHYLSFTLTGNQFTKGRLQIKGVKNYQVFVDKKEAKGELSIEPRCYNVTMSVLTKAGDKDSFNVAFITDIKNAVQINAEGKHPYTITDLMNGLHYGGVKVSPSGKYLITDYYDALNDGSSTWYSKITELSSGKLLITKNPFLSLNWLPKRDMMYYIRNTSDSRDLILIDPVSLKETVWITNLPKGSFTISPTEDYLIYTLTKDGPKDEGPLKQILLPDDRMPGWRNRSFIYKFDVKTRVMQQLTYGHTSTYLSDISNDGRHILFSTSRPRLEKRPFRLTSLFRMDMQTYKVDTLLNDEEFVNNFSFSPDGKRILVQGSPECFNGIGKNVNKGQTPSSYDIQLYIYNPSDKQVKPLTKTFNPSVKRVEWSAHDGQIYFTADNRDCVDFYTVNPNTGTIRSYDLPVDVINGYSLSSLSTQMVFYGQTATTARTMYAFDVRDKKPRTKKIGDIDFETYSKNMAIGECHDWNFKTSRGDTIYGRYYLPPHFDANKKYPMIVYYYGGCTPTPRILEMNYPFEVFAGQEYIVYVIQPSGAIGFGQEFSARHVNAWGKMTADDIIEGTKQFCKEHAFANSSKIGCIGASYGGFTTEYLTTQTDIFATAISHAGISNIASYWGGGNWGYSYSEAASANSYPWNNPDMYVKQSPLFNADKIHTPLLLLHGSVDTNVPTNESVQLYTALKLLGREAAFVQVDGENHVISNYQKRLLWQNAIFAWFAKWLKNESTWWNTLFPEKDFK